MFTDVLSQVPPANLATLLMTANIVGKRAIVYDGAWQITVKMVHILPLNNVSALGVFLGTYDLSYDNKFERECCAVSVHFRGSMYAHVHHGNVLCINTTMPTSVSSVAKCKYGRPLGYNKLGLNNRKMRTEQLSSDG